MKETYCWLQSGTCQGPRCQAWSEEFGACWFVILARALSAEWTAASREQRWEARERERAEAQYKRGAS